MAKVFTGLVVILFLIIVMMFLPDLTASTHDTLTDSYTETANVTTGAAETTGQMTLANELYNDDVAYVTSLGSSRGTDNPVASSYSPTSGNLTISGLDANTWRTMTTIYDAEATGDYTGLKPGLQMMPTLILLSVIAISVAAIWRVFT